MITAGFVSPEVEPLGSTSGMSPSVSTSGALGSCRIRLRIALVQTVLTKTPTRSGCFCWERSVGYFTQLTLGVTLEPHSHLTLFGMNNIMVASS